MNELDLLHHYTDAAGLLGLLGKPGTDASLWLTQIQYMNDHQEWWHALDLMKDVLFEMRDGQVFELRELSWLMYPNERDLNALPARNLASFPRTFVFSLTEKGDLLSQWRGYASSGGYSVGFDKGELSRICGENGFSLIRCVYSDEEKRQKVSQLLDQLTKQIQQGYVAPHLQDDTKSTEEKVLWSAQHTLHREFSRFGTYFKHPSFEEEVEWRIVGTIPAGGTDPRERWRTRGDLILPYCAVPLQSSPDDELPIRRVIIGPADDHELASHSISFVRLGKPGTIQVAKSKSTLRR